MAAFQPKCSDEQYDAIQINLDKARQSSEYVKVPRQALANLLIDHGQLHAVLKTGC